MNNINARLVYDNAVKALLKAFGNNEKVLQVSKLTQGYLRFEQPLVANSTLYTFPILDNQNIYATTEKRLKLQDSFIVSEIGIFTAAAASATDDVFSLDSYPNTQKYGASATPMLALYNAEMSIAVNNDIILPSWDIWRHYNVNQTQQTAALGAGSPEDQQRGSFDGLYPVEPNIVFIGSKNTVLQITFKGAGITSVVANSRIVILVRGVLAQNSTVVS